MGEEAVAEYLVKYVSYLFYSQGNKMSTIAGKIVAVQMFHRRIGMELPMKSQFFWAAKAGLARELGRARYMVQPHELGAPFPGQF